MRLLVGPPRTSFRQGSALVGPPRTLQLLVFFFFFPARGPSWDFGGLSRGPSADLLPAGVCARGPSTGFVVFFFAPCSWALHRLGRFCSWALRGLGGFARGPSDGLGGFARGPSTDLGGFFAPARGPSADFAVCSWALRRLGRFLLVGPPWTLWFSLRSWALLGLCGFARGPSTDLGGLLVGPPRTWAVLAPARGPSMDFVVFAPARGPSMDFVVFAPARGPSMGLCGFFRSCSWTRQLFAPACGPSTGFCLGIQRVAGAALQSPPVSPPSPPLLVGPRGASPACQAGRSWAPGKGCSWGLLGSARGSSWAASRCPWALPACEGRPARGPSWGLLALPSGPLVGPRERLLVGPPRFRPWALPTTSRCPWALPPLPPACCGAACFFFFVVGVRQIDARGPSWVLPSLPSWLLVGPSAGNAGWTARPAHMEGGGVPRGPCMHRRHSISLPPTPLLRNSPPPNTL